MVSRLVLALGLLVVAKAIRIEDAPAKEKANSTADFAEILNAGENASSVEEHQAAIVRLQRQLADATQKVADAEKTAKLQEEEHKIKAAAITENVKRLAAEAKLTQYKAAVFKIDRQSVERQAEAINPDIVQKWRAEFDAQRAANKTKEEEVKAQKIKLTEARSAILKQLQQEDTSKMSERERKVHATALTLAKEDVEQARAANAGNITQDAEVLQKSKKLETDVANQAENSAAKAEQVKSNRPAELLTNDQLQNGEHKDKIDATVQKVMGNDSKDSEDDSKDSEEDDSKDSEDSENALSKEELQKPEHQTAIKQSVDKAMASVSDNLSRDTSATKSSKQAPSWWKSMLSSWY